MKVSSGFNKCSICQSEGKLTFEHIIPESLGGFLESDLQCAKCNNDKLGSKLISKAKRTYTIRLAIRALKGELPDLFKSIEEGQEYSAKRSDDTNTTAYFKNGEIVCKASREQNGSLTVDRKDTENNLKSQLKKEGFTEEQISDKLNEFDNLLVDKPFQISKTLNVIKRKLISIIPLVGNTDMDERIIALISYNYLCMTVGEIVFNDYFEDVREFIIKGKKTAKILIEQYPYNGTYRSYHKLYRESLEDRTKVTIILFGSIGYVISFLQSKCMSNNNCVIIQNLKEKKIYYFEKIEDIKTGKYFIL